MKLILGKVGLLVKGDLCVETKKYRTFTFYIKSLKMLAIGNTL